MSLVQQWLRGEVQPYAHANHVYNDVDSALKSHPTVRPKTDVYTYDDGRAELLICIHGLLPISFRGASYNIPVAVWIPHEYPKAVPTVYVVPTSDMLVRASKSIDPSGKCSFPYMEAWERKSEGCNLRELLDIMQEHFSREPPLYAKPPPGAAKPSPAMSRNVRPEPSTSSSPRPPPRPSSQYDGAPPRPLSAVSSSSEHSQYRQPPPLPVLHNVTQPTLPRVLSPAQMQQSQHLQHSRSTSIQHTPISPSHISPPIPWNEQSTVRGPSSGHTSHHSLPFFPPVPRNQPPTLSPPPPPPMQPQRYPNQAQPGLQHSTPVPVSPPPPAPGLPQYVSPPVHIAPAMPTQGVIRLPHTSIPNIMDEDNVSAAPVQPAPPPVMAAPPPRPMNPQLAALHAALHEKFTTELAKFTASLARDSEGPRAAQNDLLAGEPAIKDEMARLESVKTVCKNVAGRLGAVVNAAENAIGELKRKGDPEVDELVCATNIVHNQLINLVAEDHAIEDTIYHLHRALNDGRLELDKFLKTTTRLAEEQFMKRALIERITSQLPMGMRMHH